MEAGVAVAVLVVFLGDDVVGDFGDAGDGEVGFFAGEASDSDVF